MACITVQSLFITYSNLATINLATINGSSTWPSKHYIQKPPSHINTSNHVWDARAHRFGDNPSNLCSANTLFLHLECYGYSMPLSHYWELSGRYQVAVLRIVVILLQCRSIARIYLVSMIMWNPPIYMTTTLHVPRKMLGLQIAIIGWV